MRFYSECWEIISQRKVHKRNPKKSKEIPPAGVGKASVGQMAKFAFCFKARQCCRCLALFTINNPLLSQQTHDRHHYYRRHCFSSSSLPQVALLSAINTKWGKVNTGLDLQQISSPLPNRVRGQPGSKSVKKYKHKYKYK